MATRNKNDLVQCEFCGEMYSTTYKRCPFCDGMGNSDPDEEPIERGGKRLAGRGGWSLGSIVGGVISLILIIAAVCIVISLVKSIMGAGNPKPTPTPDPSPIPTASEPVASQPVESQPVESVAPTPEPTPEVPAVTDFKLSNSDFTFFSAGEFYTIRVSFTPAGAGAQVTWKSSNTNVATVSESGKVTAVGKGTCTVTATVEGVGEKKAIVRCNFKETASTSTPEPTATPSSTSSSGEESNIKLSSTDFTLFRVGETATLRITGTTDTVTWSSSNTEVARVDTSGKVTAVGKGTCTVTATVNGQTFKCIVRCNLKDN